MLVLVYGSYAAQVRTRGDPCESSSSHRADPQHSAQGFALSDPASLRLDADQVRQVLKVEEQQVVAKVQEGQTLPADTKHDSAVIKTRNIEGIIGLLFAQMLIL